MRQVDLTTMMNCAYASKAKLEEEASYNGRPVRLYLHWTACGYWNSLMITILILMVMERYSYLQMILLKD